ncbi:hypothetical protein [Plantactinospora soyae]|uniref:Chromosome segregation ATPase n=1 Tax=Plantactinospora soyae TaxID=1544732 RepID=A0A927MDE1_9ACTN|nr:hypothetical protein [Plantactinospora soyae]MBE1489040.1 chromosome segregation ATPase [Plantactinospora soyae]
MSDDIEQRLTAASEAVREREVATARGEELLRRIEAATGAIDGLAALLAREQQDVDRLEGLSLTRVLASLRGDRNDALARERAETDAARYRVAEAEARLASMRREYAVLRARLAELDRAPNELAAVLDERERRLRESGDPRQAPLLELAGERGRLTAEVRETDEALRAAGRAAQALHLARDKLGSASSWSTYDTFFGGGVVGSVIKHSRLDEAAQAAARADQCLAVLRTELADVSDVPLGGPQLAIDGTTRFVDVWFDNIFTDLSVRDRIMTAQRNIEQSIQRVAEVRDRLTQRAAEARTRLAAIDAERRNLLTPR